MSNTQTIMNCRACKSPNATFLMTGKLLKENINYYQCTHCLYVQTENPYWLDKAYSDVISSSDTGILRRNQNNAKITISTLLLLGKLKSKVVDCAGGYGILVRNLRDYGIEASWSDPFCENILAKGFEYRDGIATLVTAFEAFEHFVNPLDELEKLLKIAPNVLISTELIPSPAPTQEDWWYYGKEHGQHIGFFQIRTLEMMANRLGKKVISDGKSYHLFTNSSSSKIRWKTYRFLSMLFPRIITCQLKSKTWDDHCKIASENQ